MYPGESDFKYAIQSLRQGGIVAYPTETFYGLAVDPKNDQALASLYALKKRADQKPISLIVPDLVELQLLTSSSSRTYESLIDSFWPGPLTLIFPAKNTLSRVLTGGGETIAVRISSNPVAMELCTRWGGAITATSANISGEIPLISATEVKVLLGDKIACVLDGGVAAGGLGSTIVHCSEAEKKCQIIREGAIPLSAISDKLPSHYIICKS